MLDSLFLWQNSISLNLQGMNPTVLYSLPQWFVFAALFMIVYGWVEHKKAFRLIGIATIIGLGIFSLMAVLGEELAAGAFLSPEEVAAEELNDEILHEMPLEAKLLPAYWIFMLASVCAIPTLLLDCFNKKQAKPFIIISSLIVLAGFFIIVSAVRSV